MTERNKEPLVSIVIANYNYGRFLEDAIKSVLNQSCKDFELIVIDGGSTDNSVEIIQKYCNEIAWWCSESDKGQSDAFNKGFSHAHGRFFTWLNADDILLPGTIWKLQIEAEWHPECAWFTGNFLQYRLDNRKIILAPWGPHWLPQCLQTFSYPLVIFGPTTFWSREAWETVGLMDVELRYSMDTDYWLRMKKAGYRLRRLNHCCWAFGMHDESKTAQYEGRAVAGEVKKRWYDELDRVGERAGYHCSQTLTILGRVLRLLDFSFVVALYRRLMIVGKTLDIYFK